MLGNVEVRYRWALRVLLDRQSTTYECSPD
jgi:hypothetical protein